MVYPVPVNQTYEGIVQTDYNGIVLGVNTVFELLCGYKKEELIGQKLAIFDAPDKNDRSLISQMVEHFSRDEAGWHGRLFCHARDKNEFQVEVTATPLLMEENGPYCILWVIRDLKSFKDIENQLLQAQKMEAIGTLAGGIAHDFNNVLNIVSGFTGLALRSIQNDYARRCLFNVLEASDRASDLVKQLLSFTQRESQLFMPVSMRPLIKGILKLIRSALPDSIQINFLMDEGNFQVFGNPSLLHQFFLNLATNAMRAMSPQGGTFLVEVDLIEVIKNGNLSDKIAEGRYVHIQISDTGVGMDPEIADRAFEPFFTTHNETGGTGLGLSVVAEIVKKHSGYIEMNSEIGKGTIFQVYFPEFSVGIEEEEPDIAASSEGANILLVDDERILVEVISEGLRAYGFNVTPFSDSEEALKAFSEDPEYYDLILTDFMMPKASGLELGSRVLEIRPDIPVVLCTGYLEKEEEDIAMEMGIKKVLRKPILIKTLVKEIKVFLRCNRDGDSSSDSP